MEQCPVCGGSFQGTELICPACGFDSSADREQYPTLYVPKKRCQSRKEWKAQYEQNRVDVGTIFYKLSDDDTTLYVKSGVTKIEEQDVKSSVSRSLWWLRINKPDEIKEVKKIVLPDSVTKVGKSAFEFCDGLEEIVLGCNVREIEEGAFYGCDHLRTVQISANADKEERPIKIGNGAFAGCKNLEEVLFENSAIEIGVSAFSGCKCLRRIDFLNKTKTIRACAFQGCEALQDVAFPEIIYIARNAFSGCPAALEAAAQKAAASMKDQERFEIDGEKLLGYYGEERVVYVPQGIKVIGKGSFFHNDIVEEVILPESLLVIEDYAFYRCINLCQIQLPESLEEIGAAAFDDCSSLREIQIPDQVRIVRKYIFARCKTLKTARLGKYTEELQDAVFVGCEALQQIQIPDSVKVIGDRAFFFFV